MVVGAVQTLRRSEPRERIFFFSSSLQHARALLFSPLELRFGSGEIAQAFFPLRFESACHESVFGFDRTILTLGTFGFVASAFHRQAPLTERCIVVGFELLDGELRCFQRRGRQSFEKSIDNGLIDLNAADIETVHAASLDDILARAMVSGRRVSARVVRMQPTATLSTGSQALQQCGAFSHGTSCLVWLGMHRWRQCVLGWLGTWPNRCSRDDVREEAPATRPWAEDGFACEAFLGHRRSVHDETSRRCKRQHTPDW